MSSDPDTVVGSGVATDRGPQSPVTQVRPESEIPDRVWVWGVPIDPVTMPELIVAIGEMIRAGQPSLIVTANTHYAMLTDRHPDIAAVNARARMIVADGMPLVWASRLRGKPLPRRVAGSDLIFRLSDEAASKGYRLFFLGGADGVAGEATRRLTTRYPGLQIVGSISPPFREWTPAENADLISRIRAANVDVLMVFLTMPRGERWLAAHLEELGVPVAVNLGASLDFASGKIQRAPRWLQRIGLEWAFRLWLEPKRLLGRYADNAWFIARMTAKDLWDLARGKPLSTSIPAHPEKAAD